MGRQEGHQDVSGLPQPAKRSGQARVRLCVLQKRKGHHSEYDYILHGGKSRRQSHLRAPDRFSYFCALFRVRRPDPISGQARNQRASLVHHSLLRLRENGTDTLQYGRQSLDQGDEPGNERFSGL